MTKYLTCIKCDIEQPVTQFIAMKSGEIKRTCKSCKNGHKAIIKKLRGENDYPNEDYCCPICERDIKEIEKKFNESVYELNNLKLISEDSLVFDYKIVVKEIVDSVRITVSDSLCVNCRAIQKKKENTLVSKAFKWLQKIGV